MFVMMPKFQIEVGENIELPLEEEIKIIDSSNRIYPDVFQRSEMLSDLMRMLPEGQQRNIIKLQSIRRFVELMMILRNQVVEYGVTNEPKGIQQTTKQTIAELAEDEGFFKGRGFEFGDCLLVDEGSGYRCLEG